MTVHHSSNNIKHKVLIFQNFRFFRGTQPIDPAFLLQKIKVDWVVKKLTIAFARAPTWGLSCAEFVCSKTLTMSLCRFTPSESLTAAFP
jgi:hypothetical protein